MRKILRAALLILAVGLVYFLAMRPRFDGRTEAGTYISKSEMEWAESLANGDVSVPQRIVADDFRGIETDGAVYDKAKAIDETRNGPKDYVSNHARLIVVRYFGDTAVAQGEEIWERRNSSPAKGRDIWTDTWVERNGKWQVVAAQDVRVAQ